MKLLEPMLLQSTQDAKAFTKLNKTHWKTV